MPSNCAISSCGLHWKSRRGTSIILHKFPRNKELAKKWAVLCRTKTPLPLDRAVVCSNHFKPEDYVRDLKSELLGLPPRRVLKPDAIPNQNLVSKNDTNIACLCNLENLICDIEDSSHTPVTRQKTYEVCRCGANKNPKSPKKVKIPVDLTSLPTEFVWKKQWKSFPSRVSDRSAEDNHVEENHTDVLNSTVNFSERNNYARVEAETTHNDENSSVDNSSICSGEHNPHNDPLPSGLVTEKPQNEVSHPGNNKRKSCASSECAAHKKLKLFESRDKWHSDRYKSLSAKHSLLKKQLQDYPKLKAKNEKAEKDRSEMLDNLAAVFSKTQIDFLLKSFSRGRWSDEDMYQAIVLNEMSKKTYVFLRILGFPFPSLSCIRKWAASHTELLDNKSIEDLKSMIPIYEKKLKDKPTIVEKDSGNLVSNPKKTIAKVPKTRKTDGVKRTSSKREKTVIEEGSGNLVSNQKKKTIAKVPKTGKTDGVKRTSSKRKKTVIENGAAEPMNTSSTDLSISSSTLNHSDCSSLLLSSAQCDESMPLSPEVEPELVVMEYEEAEVIIPNTITASKFSNTVIYNENNQAVANIPQILSSPPIAQNEMTADEPNFHEPNRVLLNMKQIVHQSSDVLPSSSNAVSTSPSTLTFVSIVPQQASFTTLQSQRKFMYLPMNIPKLIKNSDFSKHQRILPKQQEEAVTVTPDSANEIVA